MSASSTAKKAGLKGLALVIEMTGQSRQTLQNWHKDKPDLFNVVIAGCVALIGDRESGQKTERGHDGNEKN
jgi:hypothetical protein